MIQLSKEDTLNRYKAYLSKIHPIQAIHKPTQDLINNEVIKSINEVRKVFPNSVCPAFHYSDTTPELWRNIIMTYLIQYNNEFSKSSMMSFEVIDFYRIIEIYLRLDKQYDSIHQLTQPILFIRDEMSVQNKETENIVLQLVNFRKSLPHTKSNPHQTVLLSEHSSQWLKSKYPQLHQTFSDRHICILKQQSSIF